MWILGVRPRPEKEYINGIFVAVYSPHIFLLIFDHSSLFFPTIQPLHFLSVVVFSSPLHTTILFIPFFIYPLLRVLSSISSLLVNLLMFRLQEATKKGKLLNQYSLENIMRVRTRTHPEIGAEASTETEEVRAIIGGGEVEWF